MGRADPDQGSGDHWAPAQFDEEQVRAVQPAQLIVAQPLPVQSAES